MTGHVTDPRLVMLRVQLYTAMQTLRGEDDLGEFWALIRELASMMPDAAAVPHLTPPPPEAAVADAVLALHKVAGGGEYCQEDGFLLAMPHGSGGAGRGSRAGGSR